MNPLSVAIALTDSMARINSQTHMNASARMDLLLNASASSSGLFRVGFKNPFGEMNGTAF